MSNQRKVAVVTGASQGLGAGIVEGYRLRGYCVVVNSRSIQPSESDGEEVLVISGDIADPATAERVVSSAIQRFGRIDALVNNAGIFVSKPFIDYTSEDFSKVLSVNLAGFFHITQCALRQMLKQKNGHIVQITTTLADQPIKGMPAGLAALTKGGLNSITRSLAIEYADQGIRVNAVSPGVIKTPMHAPEAHASLAALHPMGRMGEIQDIVDAVLYLESAAFVTGEVLHVDGGEHAGKW